MFLLLLAAIAVKTDFEGGSLGRVERVAETHLRCAVAGQADSNGRNRQANWYYFRLDGLPQREVTLELTGLVGEYNFRPGSHAVTKNTRPVFSYDDRQWTHFTDDQVSWDEKEVKLTLRFTPRRGLMWIAHTEPYTGRDLARLLALRHAHLKREPLGRSLRGRPLDLLSITDPAADAAAKRVVWLIARQHAWETGTSWAADGAVRWLLSDDAKAAQLRRAAEFKVMPVFDPDGVAAGSVRFNLNGYDNNRNWDAVDPKTMPEIDAVRRAVFTWLDAGRPIHILLAMHNTESADYVEGALNEAAGIKAQAQALADCLRAETSFHDSRSPRAIPARATIDRGRQTINQHLFFERQTPAYLMELMVERHPQLGRLRTAADFSAMGPGLARCLAAAPLVR
jgi:hypothetical protein